MPTHPKAILFDLIPPTMRRIDGFERLKELEHLTTTYGGIAIVKIVQRRASPDPKTFIGSGKVEELKEEAKKLGARLLLLNNTLRYPQAYHLQELMRSSHVDVWDRIELILHIFEKHAKSQEAKLQIELAQLKHLGPRIFGMGLELSRQGGGIGTRGIGETNIEIMKRHLRERERTVRAKIGKIETMRAQQRDRRRRANLRTISIVGYTNAGKTTLLNTLSGRKEYVADKLFATLDTRIGQVFLPHKKIVALVSDTIGFIQDLPPDLIDAFRSTLGETLHANLLLHVVDAADPKRAQKIGVVECILKDLGAEKKPQLLVFNKADELSLDERRRLAKIFSSLRPLFISAQTKMGIDTLLQEIENMLL